MEKDTSAQEPYGSFDSPETAQKATGGRVYECRGYEGHAIIVEDRNGRNWLYVKPQSRKYRDVANDVWGSRMSKDGKDADHIASRDIEAKAGQNYVLMGAVDRSANRSHGTYEKPGRHLDRPFNAAAQRTEPDALALRISYRQSHKTSGKTKTAMEADADLLKSARPTVGDAQFDEATFGKAEHQARLDAMKGREIGLPAHDQDRKRPFREDPDTPEPSQDVAKAYDRHKGAKPKSPMSHFARKRR